MWIPRFSLVANRSEFKIATKGDVVFHGRARKGIPLPLGSLLVLVPVRAEVQSSAVPETTSCVVAGVIQKGSWKGMPLLKIVSAVSQHFIARNASYLILKTKPKFCSALLSLFLDSYGISYFLRCLGKIHECLNLLSV